MSELRWTLLILGVAFVAGLGWWERRRPRQAGGAGGTSRIPPREALAAEGFVLGRFAIFHKPDEEQRAVLSAASLSAPGTFDEDTMDSQHYGGLSLFAVLPGPKPPPETFEELILTARSLNDRLQGEVQDGR